MPIGLGLDAGCDFGGGGSGGGGGTQYGAGREGQRWQG